LLRIEICYRWPISQWKNDAMAASVPEETVKAFAHSIHQEATKYGFTQIDTIRLINALMDFSMDQSRNGGNTSRSEELEISTVNHSVESFPLKSSRLSIRRVDADGDKPLLESWIEDTYGRHFLLSCAAAEQHDVGALLSNERNDVGIVELLDGTPIGAVAYLDIDAGQRRAELRKLIGAKDERGKGYAEEATSLWIEYGVKHLGLEKIFVSTLQTHLRNIKLNESVGFKIEGILRAEVLMDGKRYDVLRMGFSAL
jgi:RimJ/RimL family protein N-acetyltransferase